MVALANRKAEGPPYGALLGYSVMMAGAHFRSAEKRVDVAVQVSPGLRSAAARAGLNGRMA